MGHKFSVFLIATFLLVSNSVMAQMPDGNGSESSTESQPTAPQVGAFSHVFVVLFENANYSQVITLTNFKKFFQGGALLRNYFALGHPSEPNYIGMTSGSTFNISDDNLRTLNVTNIGDLVEAHNPKLTWKAYAEGLETRSCTGNRGDYGHFLDRHVPFLTYADINTNQSRCESHVVDATELQKDLDNHALPNFSFYTPDSYNDGHDTGAQYADTYFGSTMVKYISQFPAGTLVIVAFDECENSCEPNQVYMAMQGSMVIKGSHSDTKYNHYSMLRLIENGLNIGNLGRSDKTATAISGVWK